MHQDLCQKDWFDRIWTWQILWQRETWQWQRRVRQWLWQSSCWRRWGSANTQARSCSWHRQDHQRKAQRANKGSNQVDACWWRIRNADQDRMPWKDWSPRSAFQESQCLGCPRQSGWWLSPQQVGCRDWWRWWRQFGCAPIGSECHVRSCLHHGELGGWQSRLGSNTWSLSGGILQGGCGAWNQLREGSRKIQVTERCQVHADKAGSLRLVLSRCAWCRWWHSPWDWQFGTWTWWIEEHCALCCFHCFPLWHEALCQASNWQSCHSWWEEEAISLIKASTLSWWRQGRDGICFCWWWRQRQWWRRQAMSQVFRHVQWSSCSCSCTRIVSWSRCTRCACWQQLNTNVQEGNDHPSVGGRQQATTEMEGQRNCSDGAFWANSVCSTAQQSSCCCCLLTWASCLLLHPGTRVNSKNRTHQQHCPTRALHHHFPPPAPVHCAVLVMTMRGPETVQALWWCVDRRVWSVGDGDARGFIGHWWWIMLTSLSLLSVDHLSLMTSEDHQCHHQSLSLAPVLVLTEPTKPTKTTELTELTKLTKLAELTKLAKTTKLTEPTEATEATEATELNKLNWTDWTKQTDQTEWTKQTNWTD